MKENKLVYAGEGRFIFKNLLYCIDTAFGIRRAVVVNDVLYVVDLDHVRHADYDQIKTADVMNYISETLAGREASVGVAFEVYDCNGPSWSHSHSANFFPCEVSFAEASPVPEDAMAFLRRRQAEVADFETRINIAIAQYGGVAPSSQDALATQKMILRQAWEALEG